MESTYASYLARNTGIKNGWAHALTHLREELSVVAWIRWFVFGRPRQSNASISLGTSNLEATQGQHKQGARRWQDRSKRLLWRDHYFMGFICEGWKREIDRASQRGHHGLLMAEQFASKRRQSRSCCHLGSSVDIQDLNKCKMVKAVKTHKGAAANIKFHHKLGLFSTCGLNVRYFAQRTELLLHLIWGLIALFLEKLCIKELWTHWRWWSREDFWLAAVQVALSVCWKLHLSLRSTE